MNNVPFKIQNDLNSIIRFDISFSQRS